MTAKNIRNRVWCLGCERAFEVYVSREPAVIPAPPGVDEPSQMESVYPFAYEFEVQLGVEQDGAVYAECPYEGGDGSLADFWWWDDLRRARPDVPDMPESEQEPGTVDRGIARGIGCDPPA